MVRAVGSFDKAFGNYLPSDPVFICESCGCTMEDEDNIPDVAGRVVCWSCYNEEYARCNFCGHPSFKEDMIETDGYFCCEECKEEQDE